MRPAYRPVTGIPNVRPKSGVRCPRVVVAENSAVDIAPILNEIYRNEQHGNHGRYPSPATFQDQRYRARKRYRQDGQQLDALARTKGVTEGDIKPGGPDIDRHLDDQR